MKKAKIWDKTTIIWKFGSIDGAKTNIPVDDWKDENEKYFHTLRGMRIISLNDLSEKGERQALIELDIFRVSICPTTARGKILELLMGLDYRTIRNVFSRPSSHLFSIHYALQNGESFCDSAIEKAKLIFSKFGVEDSAGREIANFLILRESLVKTSNGWIPFADYLRVKNGLKQMCSLWGEEITLGNCIFSINDRAAESNWLAKMGAK